MISFNFKNGFFLFNSLEFILFFVIVFLIYWILPRKLKNMFLLLASYVFFASWDWRFLGLLIISTFVDYFCGLKIYNAKNQKLRRLYLIVSILFNLSLLGFFKYFNFFLENLVALLSVIGFQVNITSLKIILPLGISFYTFQKLSYTVDIYRKKIFPTKKIIDFSLFVAYFPQLIAGPIERARNLIPRIQAKKLLRNVKFKEGFYLFIYGLFKKIVIADSVALIVNKIFALTNPTGAQVLIGVYAFAIQLYCDFSGYSNMARGISRFFGIKLSVNFKLPFFAKDPSEFFKRWHRTLSSWITEYVYIPLFFYLPKTFIRLIKNRQVKFYLAGAIAGFITMVIFGFWHGADWNFIFMGIFLFVSIIIFKVINIFIRKLSFIKNRFIKLVSSLLIRLLALHTIFYALFLFRAESLTQIMSFTKSLFSGIVINNLFSIDYLYLYIAFLFLIIYETIQYIKRDELIINKQNFFVQIIFYIILFFIYMEIGAITNIEFIYFLF